jgi:hypothetical protein
MTGATAVYGDGLSAPALHLDEVPSPLFRVGEPMNAPRRHVMHHISGPIGGGAPRAAATNPGR